ncbi:MAG: NUMOD4 motif-containing HNH endonuclease [Acidipropionibacterium jensenii]|uniref:NUMOD4 motif-containing HNH endonuclease n=1 Tax=Acidipropionibacterium jensenii TaxID=1749 RepID=UPI0026499C43|nr:NUMOD4 motif-containing HNH endonuclease [Acidipropionibacterium jensenii]MDN6440479.1 NUMOD4 motif-containing HNH endonuclease [Acidipropionibacterium jensenii]
MNSTRSGHERWNAIPGYEGLYEVSDLGNVRSVDRWLETKAGVNRFYRGKTLKAVPSTFGHLTVQLGADNRKLIHRLVMEAFVGPCPEGMWVCHWNDIPTDNRLSNLRYGTPKGNSADLKRNKGHANSHKNVCPRGHVLAEPNLVPSQVKIGGRVCLACQRTHSRLAKRKELKPHFDLIADQYYQSIMRDDPAA